MFISTFLISNSVFEDNQAAVAGGGLYWNYVPPFELSNVTFLNNSASIYGPNVASFAIGLVLLNPNFTQRRNNKNVVGSFSKLLAALSDELGNLSLIPGTSLMIFLDISAINSTESD